MSTPRRLRSWTYREVKELVRLAGIGTDTAVIAHTLNRSSYSIRQKAFWQNLELRLRWGAGDSLCGFRKPSAQIPRLHEFG